jgi:hypothetical protein
MLAPRQWADLRDALTALRRRLEETGDAYAVKLLGAVEDGCMDFAVVSHSNGLRAGAAY